MHSPALTALLHRALVARASRLMELTAGDGWRRDPAGLHDVRVASRRVRAVLALADPADFPGLEGQRRRLKALTRTLGATRELDVHLESLEALATRELDTAALAGLEYARELLETSRLRARRRMERRLAKSDPPECSRLLRACPPRGEEAPGDLGDEVRACLEPRLRAALEALPDRMEAEDAAALHALRIRMKKARYALEILAPGLVGDPAPALESLRGLQVVLGEHHDLALLEARLRELHDGLAGRRRPLLAGGLLGLLGLVTGARRAAFERFRELGRDLAPACSGLLRPEAPE